MNAFVFGWALATGLVFGWHSYPLFRRALLWFLRRR